MNGVLCDIRQNEMEELLKNIFLDTLVTREEFPKAKFFIKNALQWSKRDDPPQFIHPPLLHPNMKSRCSPRNVLLYLRSQNDARLQAVIGFRLWKIALKPSEDPSYVAPVHVLVKKTHDDKSTTYFDVTPSEPGDEQKMQIFVPCSTLYTEQGITVDHIMRMCDEGFLPRLGIIVSDKKTYDLKVMDSMKDLVQFKTQNLILSCFVDISRLLKGGMKEEEIYALGKVYDMYGKAYIPADALIKFGIFK